MLIKTVKKIKNIIFTNSKDLKEPPRIGHHTVKYVSALNAINSNN